MKYTLTFCLLYLVMFPAPGQPMTEIRERFHQAVLNGDSIENFHRYIEGVSNTAPAVIAYQAAGEAMMAQTLWNPLAKLAQIKRYDELIKKAVEMDADNLEIHFLRFAIEYYLPRILMMSTHLEEDRDFIMANLWRCEQMNINPEFERYITYFMKETGMLLPEQITVIRELLNKGKSD